MMCCIAEVPELSAASMKEQELPVVSVLETEEDTIQIQVVETLGQVHQVNGFRLLLTGWKAALVNDTMVMDLGAD